MIRNATMADIKEIHALLSHFATQGMLLGRALSSLYDQLRDFKAIERHIALVAVVYSLLRAAQHDLALRDKLQRELIVKN
jgi:amino-acid N-acetyltransferase